MKYYIVDFDGTVTLSDSLVEVFEKYCVTDWLVPERKMLKGEISRTQALTEEVGLMRVDEKELYDFISEKIRIRNGFSEFVERVHRDGNKMMILSGGFRSFIEYILGKGRYGDLPLQIIANDIKYMSDGKWEFIPCPDTLPQLCGTCPNCKKAMVEKIISEGYETIYIGDGETDICASAQAHMIWATGSLIDRLEKKGVRHRTFNDFLEIG